MKARLMTAMLALMLGASMAPRAEDIDLFVGAQASSTDLPSVLIILDNTANWTQAFTNEMSALTSVFASLPTDKVRVGVMFAAETSKADNNVQGGYVRAAIRPMNEVNKKAYSEMFAYMDVNNDKGNSGQSSLVMAEAYRYFSRGIPRSGNYKAKTDYKGNTGADWSKSATSDDSKKAMQAIYALDGNALDSKTATQYNPYDKDGSGCAKKFIIYISNGPSQDSSSIISDATAMLKQA
ncbi:MAG: pilus assembly protein PilY, partial [Steroidobacteraceae bacterium]